MTTDPQPAQDAPTRRWIRTSEQLPVDGQPVWLYEGSSPHLRGIVEGSYYRGAFYYYDDPELDVNNVTHWMPREEPPAPPSEETPEKPKCPNDTDGDGNCHVCHKHGRCLFTGGAAPTTPPAPSKAVELAKSLRRHQLVADTGWPQDDRTYDEAAAELERLTGVEALLTKLREDMKDEWADKPDQWTPEIEAAHPENTDDHRRYGVALEMVGHRHGKYELVDLVNWLLSRAEKAEAERGAAVNEAGSAHGLISDLDAQLTAKTRLTEKLRELMMGLKSYCDQLNTRPVGERYLKDIDEALALTVADMEDKTK